MTAVLAQMSFGGYSLLQILIIIIVIAAGFAITQAILAAMGKQIPPVVIQVFWILCLAALGIIALIFLFSFIGRIG